MSSGRFAERLGRTEGDTASPRSEETPVGALVVGAADDRAEVEADRVAGEVIARLQGGEGPAHAHSAGGGHGGVRRSAAPVGAAEVGLEGGAISADLSARIEGKRGGGASLSGGVRSRMEAGFGGSLAQVRVHADSESAALNRAVSARAFTTGHDIFFGAGEYRPDTPDGERVLAHELAHTRQLGGGARRTVIRRWDLGAKTLDFSSVKTVGTVPSGQAVFFFKDDAGENIVVKAEDKQVGLSELSSVMHVALSNVKSVHHRKLGGGELGSALGYILDPRMMDRPSWTKLGAEKKSDWKLKGMVADYEAKHGPDFDLAEFGHSVHEEQLTGPHRPRTFVAMDFAGGDTASKTTQKAQDDPYAKPEANRMRSLTTNFKHMENLGQMTAVDIFLGNKDRVMAGNLGNWIYDPHSAAITAIDHVDGAVGGGFTNNEVKIELLAKKAIPNTAKEALDNLAFGMRLSGDKEFEAWIDAEGGKRRELMEEALESGLRIGRDLLIKTFTATRFSTGKAGKQARAVKKSIKESAREAIGVDKGTGPGVDIDQYYKTLKQRAEWLKKH
jgi:hypothetical protein